LVSSLAPPVQAAVRARGLDRAACRTFADRRAAASAGRVRAGHLLRAANVLRNKSVDHKLQCLLLAGDGACAL